MAIAEQYSLVGDTVREYFSAHSKDIPFADFILDLEFCGLHFFTGAGPGQYVAQVDVEISEMAPEVPEFGSCGNGIWMLSLLMDGLAVAELDLSGRCDW